MRLSSIEWCNVCDTYTSQEIRVKDLKCKICYRANELLTLNEAEKRLEAYLDKVARKEIIVPNTESW